jgi:hypothetical protein
MANNSDINIRIKASDEATPVINKVKTELVNTPKTIPPIRLKAIDEASALLTKLKTNLASVQTAATQVKIKAVDDATPVIAKVKKELVDIQKEAKPIIIKAKDDATATINKVKNELKAAETVGSGFGKGVSAGATAATGPLAGLKNALSGVSEKFGELSGTGGAVGGMLGNISGSIMSMISPATAAIAILGGLVLGLKSVITEAIETEAAWTRVANVLQNSGQYTDKTMADVQELGAAMQELRGIDGEVIGEQFAQLATSISDTDNAYRATIDLQALTQKGLVKEKAAIKGLQDAYNGIPETLAGLTVELTDYYNVNKGVMTDQELSAGLIRELETRYGGLGI